MLTIRECRKLLGKKFEKYTDEQIEMILQFLLKLAEIDGLKLKKYMK